MLGMGYDVVMERMDGVVAMVLVHRINVLRAAGQRLQLVVHAGLDVHLNETSFPWTDYYYFDVQVVRLQMLAPIQKRRWTWCCPRPNWDAAPKNSD